MTSTKSPRSVRRAAMDCLARREHSFYELKQKLQTRFPDKHPTEIKQEIERLRVENLQSDRRFTESFVRHRKSRGFGYLAIRESLRSRFVSEELIEEFLYPDDEEWQVIVAGVLDRKMSGQKTLKFGSREHLRMVRFLAGRGFPQTVIQRSLNVYLSS